MLRHLAMRKTLVRRQHCVLSTHKSSQNQASTSWRHPSTEMYICLLGIPATTPRPSNRSVWCRMVITVLWGFQGVCTSHCIAVSLCLHITIYCGVIVSVHHNILRCHCVCTSHYIGISRRLYIMLCWDFTLFVHHFILGLHNDGM